jgi:hypothetical protein
MTGFAYGIGAPTSYAGQTFPATSPYAGHAWATQPGGLQAQYVQPLQQQSLQQLLQIVPQQLQQLLHIVPQQLQHLQNVQQQQVHYLQQLLHILPQQLHQLQQLVQNLSPQLLQQPFHAAPQPFGAMQLPNVAAFGTGLSQQAAGPWGSSTAPGIPPQTFGYGAHPGQLM